jgi:hypothetical protein
MVAAAGCKAERDCVESGFSAKSMILTHLRRLLTEEKEKKKQRIKAVPKTGPSADIWQKASCTGSRNHAMLDLS